MRVRLACMLIIAESLMKLQDHNTSPPPLLMFIYFDSFSYFSVISKYYLHFWRAAKGPFKGHHRSIRHININERAYEWCVSVFAIEWASELCECKPDASCWRVYVPVMSVSVSIFSSLSSCSSPLQLWSNEFVEMCLVLQVCFHLLFFITLMSMSLQMCDVWVCLQEYH